MSGAVNVKPMVTDVFVRGAVNGWNISVMSTIPNVLMAFVIIKILKHSGLLDIIGQVFSPVMAVFGLHGEAATVLIGAWAAAPAGPYRCSTSTFRRAPISAFSRRRSSSWALRFSTWAAASA